MPSGISHTGVECCLSELWQSRATDSINELLHTFFVQLTPFLGQGWDSSEYMNSFSAIWTVKSISQIRQHNKKQVADVSVEDDFGVIRSYQIEQTSTDVQYLIDNKGESIICVHKNKDINEISCGDFLTVSVSVK